MSYPFHVLIIVGAPSLDRSWLVQRLADSREGAIVFTPSHEGYADHCHADGYSMIILDDLMMFDRDVAKETVLRMEQQAIAQDARLAFVVSDLNDLVVLDIDLVSEPMAIHLIQDKMVTLHFGSSEETWHMDDIHNALGASEDSPQKPSLKIRNS